MASFLDKLLSPNVARDIGAMGIRGTEEFDVTLMDATEKWYYKKTSVSNTGSEDLIAGNFTDYTAVDNDTAPTAVATGDKVKFLFIKNVNLINIYGYIVRNKIKNIYRLYRVSHCFIITFFRAKIIF